MLPIMPFIGFLFLAFLSAISCQAAEPLAADRTKILKSQGYAADKVYNRDDEKRCPKEIIWQVGGVPIYRNRGETPFYFKAGMRIDADGAPNAYHPQDRGLDLLEHAGKPGDWQGIALAADGQPLIQGPRDPFPGYYISQTSLFDPGKPSTDPNRYVDATKIPYIVLSKEEELKQRGGARLGDFVAVIHVPSRRLASAIVADMGPKGKIGEGSMALAESLSIPSSPRTGGVPNDVIYVVFPGSGNGRPRTLREIDTETARLFKAWGGTARLAACFPEYAWKEK